MEALSFDQLKTAVQNLNSRERIALREYLDEFKDYEELDHLITDFRAANPIPDWEEVMKQARTAVTETRNAKAHRRVRHQRVRQRPHRKARTARARS